MKRDDSAKDKLIGWLVTDLCKRECTYNGIATAMAKRGLCIDCNEYITTCGCEHEICSFVEEYEVTLEESQSSEICRTSPPSKLDCSVVMPSENTTLDLPTAPLSEPIPFDFDGASVIKNNSEERFVCDEM